MTDTKALLARVDLVTLVEADGVKLRGGAEKVGACPKCGGKDRFHVKINNGVGYFFCRQCHFNEGGHQWHDAIEYVQWTRGGSFADAVNYLGGQTSSTVAPTFHAVTQTAQADEDLPPSDKWRAKADAFVNYCAVKLWSPEGAEALAYLRGRGLTDETIRAYKLGFNATWVTRKPEDWGLDPKAHDKISAQPGVVIPTTILTEVWSVNIRQLGADVPKDRRYLVVTGSKKKSLFNYDGLKGAQIGLLCAGEFDAMLIGQYLPAGACAVALGSETMRPSTRWLAPLVGLKRLIVCFDRDIAGDKGAAMWASLKRAEFVNVPQGKDIGDLYSLAGAAGLRSWLAQLGLYTWVPPADKVEALKLAGQFLIDIASDQLTPDDEALSIYRWQACLDPAGLSSDGLKWLDLAQGVT